MWKVLIIIIVAGGIIYFQVPTLLKKELKRELLVFSLLLTFGVIYSTLYAIGIKLINPADLMTDLYKLCIKFITSI